MPETRHAIEITWLTKSFGDNMVLRGIELTVPTGSVWRSPRTQRRVDACRAGLGSPSTSHSRR